MGRDLENNRSGFIPRPVATPQEIKDFAERNRATGKTTRIVDKLVQDLFTTGKCQIYEDEGDIAIMKQKGISTRPLLRYTLDRLLKRLESEHSTHQVKVDSRTFTVTLVK